MSAFDDWEMTYIEQGEYGNYTYSDMEAAFYAGMEHAIKAGEFMASAGGSGLEVLKEIRKKIDG